MAPSEMPHQLDPQTGNYASQIVEGAMTLVERSEYLPIDITKIGVSANF